MCAEGLEHIKNLKGLRYLCYGLEVGEGTEAVPNGTPHAQGMLIWKDSKPLSATIKKLPGCHIEICRAPYRSMQYCKKGEQPKAECEQPKAELVGSIKVGR